MAILPERLKIQLLTHDVNEGKAESICNCIAKVQPAFRRGLNSMDEERVAGQGPTLNKCLRTCIAF
ncbi:hypothetical protein SAMN05216311_10424 [Chitinophaga sp. CF418]|nr:hypothetical protein SAMN05216311_10424 [Chitinophaga sp. CF418]